MPDSHLDRWIRRAAIATLLALAVALAGTGVVLYGPAASAAPAITQGAVQPSP